MCHLLGAIGVWATFLALTENVTFVTMYDKIALLKVQPIAA